VNAGVTQVDCPLDPIDAGFGDGFRVAMSSADGFTGTSTEVQFVAVNDATTQDTLVETTQWDRFPTCASSGYFQGETTRAQLQADGSFAIALECTDPDGGALTIAPKTGAYGTMTGSGTSATFTASPATLASPSGFFEYFELELTDGEGDVTTANVFVAAYTQSDLATTLTGPTSFAVPAAGGTVTYTNTVRNAGPDTIGKLGFGWEISDKATLVSATANGAAVTCEPAMYGGPGFVAYGCGSVAMPAVGGTAVGTITLRFASGEKGLALPASAKVVTSAHPDSTTGAQDRSHTDNRGELTTSLTAYVAPTPAPPTTTTSTTKVGSAGSDVFRGGLGIDVFSGGAGNDVFDGGAGDDTFSGGNGNDAGFGGTGADRLFGGRGRDRMVGGDGADRVLGQIGNDRLYGSTGSDTVNGGTGNDVVRGGSGTDRVFCGTGIDIATGDRGMDLIGCRDRKGGDTLSGGPGLDTCVGDTGDRFLSCEVIVRV
jgi:uncharacterized repeat protein (TIGR01451 family)